MRATCVVWSLLIPASFAADRPTESQTPPARNPALAAMPDNSWLNLKPQGMAYARMYSGCCAGGGYLWYFGGAHRAYKGNDVQLYDPRANRWIQATEPEWPEVGGPDWKAMTSGGGSTSRLSPTGRPFTEHTYQQVCWQPGRKRFFIVLVSSGTWEFDPAQRQWIHLINRFEDRSEPRGHWAQNHVLYEPALQTPVLICGAGQTGVFAFDQEKRRWKQLGERPAELAWNEFYSTYVPEWKCHLISTMKRGFFRYDVPANQLTPIESPEPLRRCQSLAYDQANRVVIALAQRAIDARRRTVIPWALDVATLRWSELDPPKPWPQGQATGSWAKLWYDPDHNVHLFVNDVKRDRQELFDGGVTETWAYRYKQPRLSASQIFTVRSHEVDARRLPSGLNCNCQIVSVWPRIRHRHAPPGTSHSVIVASSPPVATRRPSGEIASDGHWPESRRQTRWPFSKSHRSVL